MSDERPLGTGFSDWYPLTAEGVRSHAPDAPAALQLSRLDRSLVRYPKGRSAMVFYCYAARSAREALQRLFAEELEETGARGQGALAFRFLPGGDDARHHLERLYLEFEERFGRAPVLHPDPADDAHDGDDGDDGHDGHDGPSTS